VVLLTGVESDGDSVFDEENISSAQQILNQGAGTSISSHSQLHTATLDPMPLNLAAEPNFCASSRKITDRLNLRLAEKPPGKNVLAITLIFEG